MDGSGLNETILVFVDQSQNNSLQPFSQEFGQELNGGI
jgi:hypothetical protein